MEDRRSATSEIIGVIEAMTPTSKKSKKHGQKSKENKRSLANEKNLDLAEKSDRSTVCSKFLWTNLEDECPFNRKETEEYIKRRNEKKQVCPSPEVAYLNDIVFPLLREGLIDMLKKVKEDDSFYRFNTTFNGLDYLSEFLYNKNPNHPERESSWTYIFDMQWVEECLNKKPRAHYAFHLIWTQDFAALKIQSYMRGYWARCRPNVQELRQFWKTLKEDKQAPLDDVNDSIE